MLQSNFCDYNNPYILVRADETNIGHNVNQWTFKNCAAFIKSITKIDRTTMHDVNDLDLVMPIYNLLVYSSNYSDTMGSLWFYSKHEAINFNLDVVDCTA